MYICGWRSEFNLDNGRCGSGGCAMSVMSERREGWFFATIWEIYLGGGEIR